MISHGGYGERVVERERAGGRREEKKGRGRKVRGILLYGHIPGTFPKSTPALPLPSATHITNLEIIDLPVELLSWSRTGTM